MSISASRTIIVGVVGILTACSEPTAPSPVDATAPLQDRAAVYEITVLPTLWGYSEVHAINDAGDAVGFSQVEGFFGQRRHGGRRRNHGENSAGGAGTVKGEGER